MAMIENGSPGSHLHNWQPGDDDAEELALQKLADAIRDGASERKLAKLLDLPRTKIWRMKNMAAVPSLLGDLLWEAGVRRRELAAIGRALKDGKELQRGEVQCCPNCGHRLRVRRDVSQKAAGIVADYLTAMVALEGC